MVLLQLLLAVAHFYPFFALALREIEAVITGGPLLLLLLLVVIALVGRREIPGILLLLPGVLVETHAAEENLQAVPVMPEENLEEI